MKKIERILFFVEDKPDHEVIARAMNGAALHGAKLTLAAVVPRLLPRTVLYRHGIDGDELERALTQERQQQLDDAVHSVGRPDVETSTVVLTGRPVESIVRYAQEQRIDILVKEPSPTDGLRKETLGSTDLRLLRTAPCAVAIGRPRTTQGPSRAVVGVDIDDGDAQAALNRGLLDSIIVARAGEHVETYVVHAWDLYGYSILATGRGRIPPDALEAALEEERTTRQEWLETLIESHRQTLSSEEAALFDPKPLLVRGDARKVIPEKVRELEADILGVGTAARSGVKGLVIGNTAEEILHRVDCAVVVHRPS